MRPILFHLPGGIPVFGYGVMLGLSCVLGAHLAVYWGERTAIPPRRSWWFVVGVIVLGILGGRLHELWVLDKLTFDELFQLQHSGRTAYGGFLGATAAGIVLAPLLRIPFWRMADAVAPTLALGLGLTRIGCFLYGCDYGFQTDTFGVCFPKGPLASGSPAWRDQVEAGWIPATATESLPVFPAQLAESAVGFALFALLVWLWTRRPRREGTVLLWFFFGYGLARAALEHFVRADSGRGELLGLSTSTTIGLITAALSALLLFVPPLAALRPEAAPLLPADEGEGDQAEPAAPAAEEPDAAASGASPRRRRRRRR